MGPLSRLLLPLACTLVAASGAAAHEVAPGGSGLLHSLDGPSHFLEFLVVGVMGRLYVRRFGGALYVCGVMLPLVLLASHSHVALFTGAGLVFAAGFLAAGFLIAFLTAHITLALFESRGVEERGVEAPGARPAGSERD